MKNKGFSQYFARKVDLAWPCSELFERFWFWTVLYRQRSPHVCLQERRALERKISELEEEVKVRIDLNTFHAETCLSYC